VKFIDETVITVESGNGGSGCVSFRREAHIPRGGPDGGDGGRGGSVILSATSHHHSLYPFRFKRHFKAKNGAHGQGRQKTGKNGEDLIIEIPPGTLARDADTGEILKDFDKPRENFAVANGGRGGSGNRRFKTSTNRAPRFAQPGGAGKFLTLKLELKLIADVGIIGLPNAGKSTLIQAVSSAHPKIADYPFTTLVPNLGVVEAEGKDPLVMADIPGLIEGAHRGAGLGIRFLRHIERTRILVHLIDGTAIDSIDPLSAYNTVNRELFEYNPALGEKPQLVVINKKDLPEARQAIPCFIEAAKEVPVFCISALTGQGIQEVLSELRIMLDEIFQRDMSDGS
jgi:GTPase